MNNFCILVVEDNVGDYTLVEDFIIDQIHDAKIIHASTFGAAKRILEQSDSKCSIVLLDLSLPDLTGETLIREIIGICLEIPVVVLTGYTDFSFGVKSLSMGVSDYLLKEDLTATNLYKSIIYSTERKKIMTALESSEKRARGFAGRLNNAIEEERAHMAREIHDEFGQHLSGLKMSLSALKKRTPSGQELVEHIDTLIDDLNLSIQSVRRLANELRPVLIDKLGLFASIEWLITAFMKKTGTKASFFSTVVEPNMNKQVEINVFRICQEALTNIAKHAEATTVSVQIANAENHLVVKIIDNGKGMEQNNLGEILSMGLMNMKERANLINAKLVIKSTRLEGTIIELIIYNND
jgi:signal transduction histidine kinase